MLRKVDKISTNHSIKWTNCCCSNCILLYIVVYLFVFVVMCLVLLSLVAAAFLTNKDVYNFDL